MELLKVCKQIIINPPKRYGGTYSAAFVIDSYVNGYFIADTPFNPDGGHPVASCWLLGNELNEGTQIYALDAICSHITQSALESLTLDDQAYVKGFLTVVSDAWRPPTGDIPEIKNGEPGNVLDSGYYFKQRMCYRGGSGSYCEWNCYAHNTGDSTDQYGAYRTPYVYRAYVRMYEPYSREFTFTSILNYKTYHVHGSRTDGEFTFTAEMIYDPFSEENLPHIPPVEPPVAPPKPECAEGDKKAGYVCDGGKWVLHTPPVEPPVEPEPPEPPVVPPVVPPVAPPKYLTPAQADERVRAGLPCYIKCTLPILDMLPGIPYATGAWVLPFFTITSEP